MLGSGLVECERILNSDIVGAANLVGAPFGVVGKRRVNLVGNGLKHRKLGSRFPARPAETTVAFQTCCTCCYWTRISFTDLGSHSELCTSYPRDSGIFICIFLSLTDLGSYSGLCRPFVSCLRDVFLTLLKLTGLFLRQLGFQTKVLFKVLARSKMDVRNRA